MGRYKGISTSVPSADSATAYKRKHRICVNFLKKKYLHDPCIKRCRHMILGHVTLQSPKTRAFKDGLPEIFQWTHRP